MAESTAEIQRSETGLFALATAFAKSGMFSEALDAPKALVKITAGRELGFGAFAAMTGIIVQKGKLSLSAHLMAAAIRRSDHYDYRIVEHSEQKCSIEFTRDGAVIGVSTFTMEDAARAGLLKNDTWKHYPRNMLYSRAMTNGGKWHCPDVFNGAVYTPDELGLSIDGETLQLIESMPDHSTPAAPPPPPPPADAPTYVATDTPPPPPPAPPADAGVGSANDPAPATIAPPPPPPPPADPSRADVSELNRLIQVHHLDDELIAKWRKHFNVATLEDLAQEQVDRLVEAVNQRVAQPNKGA